MDFLNVLTDIVNVLGYILLQVTDRLFHVLFVLLDVILQIREGFFQYYESRRARYADAGNDPNQFMIDKLCSKGVVNAGESYIGYEGTNSACTKVKEKGVFTCTDMAPIAVNDTLAYAYVAGTTESKCGKCYHLQYDGHFKDEFEQNPPKATHKALKGKHLVVMASNIGGDVAAGNSELPAGQFDLMVPGGGVGAFDALSIQVNKGADFNWGAGFGGFLTECQKHDNCGTEGSLECYQTCVKDMCEAAFGDAGLPNLLRGCNWFADWYMAADNPTYYIEEVECPQYLIDHYMSRINASNETNIKKVEDWSTFKEGDVLDTLHCWKAGEAPPENGWQNPSAGCDVQ